MKKIKIYAVLLLCVVMVLPFIACNNDEKPTTPDVTTPTDNIAESDPDAPNIPGYSSNDAFDMGGKVFTIAINYAKGTLNSNILIDEPTEDGDPILEASYYRKSKYFWATVKL